MPEKELCLCKFNFVDGVAAVMKFQFRPVMLQQLDCKCNYLCLETVEPCHSVGHLECAIFIMINSRQGMGLKLKANLHT